TTAHSGSCPVEVEQVQGAHRDGQRNQEAGEPGPGEVRVIPGMAALRLAYSPFWKAQNSTHSAVTPTTVFCADGTARAAALSSAMTSGQRCRRPVIRPSA